jgi:hypothetical protein
LPRRAGEPFGRPGVSPLFSGMGGNPMWFHLKDHFATETVSKLAIIVFMGLFAAAILYQGASFIVQSRTAQSAIPSLPHYVD